MIVEALTDLRDMDVREVMTPRLDVVALSVPVSADDVAQAVREGGHSAFPVVHGGLDDLVGVLYVNDLFRSRRSGRGALFTGSPQGAVQAAAADVGGLSPLEVSRRIRQPFVIPESRPILAALVEMRRNHRGFAVVVDEYGGLAGVLTVKDLLEPIVGELHDELDADEGPSIVRVDGTRWLLDGRTNVDEVRERLGIDVPEGDYVTIGGYLLDGLGHIPAVGEALGVDGWELTVQEMDRRRIASVVARRADAEVDAGPGSGDLAGVRSQPSEEDPQPAPGGSRIGAAPERVAGPGGARVPRAATGGADPPMS